MNITKPRRYNFISQQIINPYKLNAKKYVGPMMEIASNAILDGVSTEEEFFEYYQAYLTANNIDIYIAINKAYEEAIKTYPDITYDDIHDSFYIMTVHNTWQGIQRELDFEEWFKAIYPGLDIYHTDNAFDRKYNVDYLIYKDDHFLTGVQVKPLTYFMKKNYNWTTNKTKMDKFNKDYGKHVVEVAVENKMVCKGFAALLSEISNQSINI